MTTPISPDRPPSPDSGNLAPAIDAIAAGDFSRSRLASFSDLDRKRMTYLRSRWLDVPAIERHALLLALAELAEESLDFNFNRVFRVALDDPDPVIRQLAIDDLWEDDGADLLGVFARIVREDPSDDVRAAAAGALTVYCDAISDAEPQLSGAEELIDLLGGIVENPNEPPVVRRRALGAIAAFTRSPRVDELIRLGLDDADQAVVAGAVYAMGRTASAKWLPILLEFMKSEDAELRFESARAASMLGEADAVPELAELAHDPDAEVRAAAVEALGSIGGPMAIRTLRNFAQDADFEEADELDDALDAALLTVNPLKRPS